MNRQTIRYALAVPALVVALSTAGACGGDDQPQVAGVGPSPATTTTAPASGGDATFASCMRDEGIDMADPDPTTGIAALGPGVDRGSKAYKDAMAACAHLLPAGRGSGHAGTHDLDQYRAFAACMRENGFPDFPDPQPGSGGMFAGAGIDRENPAFRQASKTCAPTLPGAGGAG
jgi:hypothetical protein